MSKSFSTTKIKTQHESKYYCCKDYNTANKINKLVKI